MLKRIICPNPLHRESTPSCVIYPTHAFCFGCNTRFDLKTLNIEPGEQEYVENRTNIVAELARINSLPKMAFRGLVLPFDDNSCYLVWPNGDYFIARSRLSNSGRKYLCPTGLRRPLYRARVGTKSDTLVIIEGELEAASLAQVPGTFDIVSPGAATNFNIDRDLKIYLTYRRFYVIVDKDRAGFSAAVAMKAQLLKHTPYVTIVFKDPEKDINDILCQEGTDGVEKWLRANGLAHTDAAQRKNVNT